MKTKRTGRHPCTRQKILQEDALRSVSLSLDRIFIRGILPMAVYEARMTAVFNVLEFDAALLLRVATTPHGGQNHS